MTTTIAASLIAVGGTLVGTLSATGFGLWAERKRVADADRYRNHELRARLATDFLTAFDAYRRDIKYGNRETLDHDARLATDLKHRLKLFFADSVFNAADAAMKEIVDAQYADGPARDQHLKSAEDMRNALIEEMRQEVEPLPR